MSNKRMKTLNKMNSMTHSNSYHLKTVKDNSKIVLNNIKSYKSYKIYIEVFKYHLANPFLSYSRIDF